MTEKKERGLIEVVVQSRFELKILNHIINKIIENLDMGPLPCTVPVAVVVQGEDIVTGGIEELCDMMVSSRMLGESVCQDDVSAKRLKTNKQ